MLTATPLHRETETLENYVSGPYLGRCETHRLMRLVVAAIRNHFGIEAYGVACAYQDTEATYAITCDSRLSQADQRLLKAFVQGVKAGVTML